MKKLLLPLLLLHVALVASAADTALKVLLTDGNSATYMLSDKPKVTFTGEDMNIVSSSASTSYQRSTVASVTFVDAESAIGDIRAKAVTYRYAGSRFEAEGCDITVYSITGATMLRGTDSVSLEHLEPGVYVVKAGNQSIKIRKH